jgi:CO/xanthine dehydrogenase Mo-binding subunit
VGAWEIECARLARQAGAPVKVRLDPRAAASNGNPATLIEIEVEATADGKLTAPPPDFGLFVTSLALDDLAAALGIDPIEFLLLNFPDSRERLEAADRLFGWRRRWHPRGDSGRGPLRRGFGLSFHPAGVHMADVSVDAGTGVVRVQKLAAVDDAADRAGLVLGISRALFEKSGPGFADTGELLVQRSGESAPDSEATFLSTVAALSNAVTNALGIRISDLPFTPDRVLDALGGKI